MPEVSTMTAYLNVGGMDAPALTGYAVRLLIAGHPAPADEKLNRCASMGEIVSRNAASKKLQATFSPTGAW